MQRKYLLRYVLLAIALFLVTLIFILLLTSSGGEATDDRFVGIVLLIILPLCLIVAPLIALIDLSRIFFKKKLRELFAKEREETGNSKLLLRNYALIGILVFLCVGAMAFFDAFHSIDRVLVGLPVKREAIPTSEINYLYVANVKPIDSEYLAACLSIVKDLKAAGTKAVLVPIPADFGPTEDNLSVIDTLMKTGIVVLGAQPARVRQTFQGEWTANDPTNLQRVIPWGVITGEEMPFSVQYVPNAYWVLASVLRVPDISLELVRKYAAYPDDMAIKRVNNTVILGDYKVPVFRGGYTYLAYAIEVADTSVTAKYNKDTRKFDFLLRSKDYWAVDTVRIPESAVGGLYRGKITILLPYFESNQAYQNLFYYRDIISGILLGKLLHPLDAWNPIFILLAILFAGWMCYKLPNRHAVPLLGGSMALILAGGLFLVNAARAFIETPSVILAIVLCAASMPIAKSGQKKRHLGELMSLEMEKKKVLESQKDELERRVADRTMELKTEKEETERLLYNILPVEIARELKEKGTTTPRRYEEVTILFTDFRGFTNTVAAMPPKRLVEELNDIFRDIDDIIDKHGLEKIKTIGDSYMIAAGLPKESGNHAAQCVKAALEMVQFIAKRNESSSIKWQMRVGIHSGAAVAGVVGKKKFTYDVWGDTVNIASRMETSGEPGKINISAYTHDLIKDSFVCEYRGKIDAKGKGEIDMYFVVGEKV